MKIDQKEEKRERNKAYALKFKKTNDKNARKKARKLATIEREKRWEAAFWAKEANRRDWPVGHPNAA